MNPNFIETQDATIVRRYTKRRHTFSSATNLWHFIHQVPMFFYLSPNAARRSSLVHFIKIKVEGFLAYTLGFLAEFSFTPLLYHPGGCLGCPEKTTRSRNNNLFVKSAVFQPKWNDIQKTYKNHQNPVKSYCFLGYFQSWFNFGWKTAAQTN